MRIAITVFTICMSDRKERIASKVERNPVGLWMGVVGSNFKQKPVGLRVERMS